MHEQRAYCESCLAAYHLLSCHLCALSVVGLRPGISYNRFAIRSLVFPQPFLTQGEHIIHGLRCRATELLQLGLQHSPLFGVFNSYVHKDDFGQYQVRVLGQLGLLGVRQARVRSNSCVHSTYRGAFARHLGIEGPLSHQSQGLQQAAWHIKMAKEDQRAPVGKNGIWQPRTRFRHTVSTSHAV